MNSIQVTQDGKQFTVHEPRAKDSAWVMKALRPMVALRKGNKSVNITDAIDQCMGDEAAVAGFIRVIAACADISEEDAGELGMGVLYAMLGSAMTLVEMGNAPLAPATTPSSRSTSGRPVKK